MLYKSIQECLISDIVRSRISFCFFIYFIFLFIATICSFFMLLFSLKSLNSFLIAILKFLLAKSNNCVGYTVIFIDFFLKLWSHFLLLYISYWLCAVCCTCYIVKSLDYAFFIERVEFCSGRQCIYNLSYSY